MTSLRTNITFFLFLVFMIGGNAGGQTHEMKIDSLSLDRALELTLKYQPSIRTAEANERVMDAGVTKSVAAYLPNIVGSASEVHNQGWFVFSPVITPSQSKYDQATAGFSGSQEIYDFGKTTGRISTSKRLSDASVGDYNATRDLAVMNTEQAYFAYIQARQVEVVNGEALKKAQDHLTQAKAFVSVGTHPQSDATKAEVDVANADVNLIHARNQTRVAKAQLDNAMGITTSSDYAVDDSMESPTFDMSIDAAKSQALANRPDVQAAQARVQAADDSVSATWDQNLPTLTANGAYNWSNFSLPLLPKWNLGVTLTLPIFEGFYINGEIDQAQAQRDAARASLDELEQGVLLDVEQSYLNVKEAEERITAAQKLVQSSEESYTLISKQYAAGVSSALDVTDAQLDLSNSHITLIQAQFDYKSSLSQLKKAIGGKF